MTYATPLTEQKFLLQHIVAIDELTRHERFADATQQVVDAIVDAIGAFAEQEFAPLLRTGDTAGPQWSDGSVTMPVGFVQAYARLVEYRWAAIAAPEAFDGMGLPYCLATILLEDLGSANMGFSLVTMLGLGAIEALSAHADADQQARYLPKLVSGEWTGTMNLTEPQAGTDVGMVRTTAAPAGDGRWRIKGQKIFITFGEHDLTDNIIHLVLARTVGAPAGTKGISLFIVPKFHLDGDGRPAARNDVRCVSIEHKMGLHASPTCVMSYGDNDECFGELVGSEFGGISIMFTMMNNARLNVANQGVAIAERASQLALAYAAQRIQSPRADGSSGSTRVAIIEHPDVRRMILRMKALTQASRALVYYAAGQVDRKELGLPGAAGRLDLVIPLAKAYCTDIGCEVASIGVQVHGGAGFVEESGAAQHYRDARIMPIYEGTNGVQAADLIGRKLTGDGGARMAELIAEIRAEAGEETHLGALVDSVEGIAAWMLKADVNDRLAGSYAFLTMTAVMTCGWLMARQFYAAGRAIGDGIGDRAFLEAKRVTARYYLDQLVPEAQGLRAQAVAGAAPLYALSADELLR